MTTSQEASPSSLALPRVASIPQNVGTLFTPQLNGWLNSVGVNLDVWQQHDLGLWLAVDASGNWSATEVGELVARQNGKGEILLAYDLLHLFVIRRRDNRNKTVVHTSHEVKTNSEALQKLESVVRANPSLMARVSQIYTGNNEQGIRLKPRPGQRRGDRIKFIARSKNSGRGFTADVMVYDEAQELGQAAYRALTYTLTTTKNRQEVFTGTVPEEGVNDSEIFEGVRDRGRAGVERFSRTLWIEYSPRGSDDYKNALQIDLGDEANWEAANPAIDIRVYRESIAEELERDKSPNKEGFARERLSIWPNRPPVDAIRLSDLDMEKWLASSEDHEISRPVVIAVALGPGGQFGTVALACRLDDGRVFVRHERTSRGTAWLSEFLPDLKAQLDDALIVVDPKNAAALMVDLERLGIKPFKMNMDEIAAAHAQFIEGVNGGQIVHRDQAEVTASLQYATTRMLGRSGFTWEPSDPTKPIAHAQAVTWACWGLKKFEALPPKTKPLVRGYA